MNMNLNYYDHEEDANGLIYSIDMIRISFEISSYKFERLLNSDLGEDTEHRLSEVRTSNASTKYKFMINWTYPLDGNGVATIGYCFNDAKWEQRFGGFIEFNPNSFAENEYFWADFEKLKGNVSILEVKRFDLAIDIPVMRDRIMVIKGNQLYNCYMHSRQNKTEYLGRRNKVGFVKIYNKQIQKDLEVPLTRVEITSSIDEIKVPRIVDLTGIKGKDNAALTAVLTNDIPSLALANLSPYYQGKICSLLEKHIVDFDADCLERIRTKVEKYIELKP